MVSLLKLSKGHILPKMLVELRNPISAHCLVVLYNVPCFMKISQKVSEF